ncbi:restriction endonuclease subunit S [Acinetobacter modestus]|uniref:restriction endonuclease subunit S n=1 Tax=Acinetobacter modestus TaxID=1776740 RepID=UPI00202E7BB3|nr:restriction endonuclease subunit S [Acinetobacter modestus]MCM1957817.1 restriction endonuclease subunit S [Acinetobacter modestus]
MTQNNQMLVNEKQIPESFKNTEIGMIPRSWKLEKLKNVTSVIIDGTHFTPTYISYGIPFLRVTDIHGALFTSEFKYISSTEHQSLIKRCKPKKGDLLLSKNGTIGIPKVVTWDWEFSIFVSLALIRPKNSFLDVNFLYQFFKSNFLDLQLSQRAKQGTVVNLHLEEIRELLIPLPVIEEQEKIATALSDTDALISELEKLIEKKQSIKTATMQQLLTGKTRLPEFALREDGTPKGYKDSELGQISEDWELLSFSEVCTFINGRAYGLHEWEKRGTPVIRLQNLTGRGEDYYYSTLNLPAKQYCDYGDLLFMWSATFGPVIWKGQKAIYHYHIWKIVCNEKVDKDFLYLTLEDMTENLKRGSSSGGTMLHVTKEIMESTLAIFPPHAEQLRIASVLNGIIQEIELLVEKLNKLKNIKQGMMQELLTGKTRLV